MVTIISVCVLWHYMMTIHMFLLFEILFYFLHQSLLQFNKIIEISVGKTGPAQTPVPQR